MYCIFNVFFLAAIDRRHVAIVDVGLPVDTSRWRPQREACRPRHFQLCRSQQTCTRAWPPLTSTACTLRWDQSPGNYPLSLFFMISSVYCRWGRVNSKFVLVFSKSLFAKLRWVPSNTQLTMVSIFARRPLSACTLYSMHVSTGTFPFPSPSLSRKQSWNNVASYCFRIDIFEFLTHVESGLVDHYDIKMLTYLMLARLANLCPNAVLQRKYHIIYLTIFKHLQHLNWPFELKLTFRTVGFEKWSMLIGCFYIYMIVDLDRIVEPLRATCTTKVKANSVKQEFEKQDELKRSAMRAVVALLQLPDAGEWRICRHSYCA